ncbi:MAG: hypothetical protein NT061_01935 [Spirochaetes bacterium]|nr:hypothetical protein [Spirochaetota bacterium]
MIAVDLDVEVDGLSAGLALSAERKSRSAGRIFVLPKGRSIVYLNLAPQGSRSLSVSFAPNDPKSFSAPSGTDWAVIRSISFAPEFHGLDLSKAGLRRISDDLVIEKGAAKTIWRFSAPYSRATAAPAVQALLLGWDLRSEADIFIAAGSALRLRAASAKRSALVPLSVMGAESSGTISLTAPTEVGLHSAYTEAIAADAGEAVDLGVILLLPPLSEGADFTYRVWDLLPGVYVFDFRNYAIQDAYLKRLAFFVEKRGFAGRLASDEEIAPLHGWNAHDYKAEDLAAFFSKAAKTGFELNAREGALRDFLISKEVIAKEGGGFKGRGGAVISISQEAPAYLRRLFLTHESSHAIFFVDDGYRKLASSLWDSMSKDERWFWKLYFGWMNYDTSSNYLMANEIQAYLIQQPVDGATQYFTETIPARLLEKHPELEGELKAYFERFGGEFARKAAILDAWLRKQYGFGAGTTLFLR